MSASKTEKNDKIKVTLIKSVIGCRINHRLCVKALGLRKIGQSVVVENRSEMLGLIKKVHYLLKVEKDYAA